MEGKQGDKAVQNSQSVLQATFIVKKSIYNVILEKDIIKWKKEPKAIKYVTVYLRDVLWVSEGAKASLSDPESDTGGFPSDCFSVCYVIRRPNHHWSHDTITFHTDTSSVTHQDIESWVTHIEQYHSQLKRPQSLLVLINPRAGSGNGPKIYQKVAAPLFKMCGIKVNAVITEKASHAAEVLDQYDLATTDGVVSVGGDGSFWQCLNGLLWRMAKDAERDLSNSSQEPVAPTLPMGLIPAGSSQWLVEYSTMTTDPLTATLQIISGHQHKVDVYSLYNAGKLVCFGAVTVAHGLIADVTQETDGMRYLGRARYWPVLAKAFLKKLRPFDAELYHKPLLAIGENPVESVSERPKRHPFCQERGEESGTSGTLTEISTADALEEEEGWEVFKGAFVSIAMFLLSVEPPAAAENDPAKLDRAVMHIHQVDSACSKIDAVKELGGLQIGKSVHARSAQTEHVRVSQATEYKVVVKNKARTETWLNVDGEVLKMEENAVYVKGHAKLLSMFGARDEA